MEQQSESRSLKLKKVQQMITQGSIKVSRGPLGRTLATLRTSQEKLQTAMVRTTGKRSATEEFRLDRLQRFGTGSLAYSSLQQGMSYFMDKELGGYVAYVPLNEPDSVVVLADPICSNENKKEFLSAFLRVKQDPIFLHITHDTATILADLGFCVNQLGVETILEIQSFALTGNKKEHLRRARNGAKKEGLTVREIDSVDDGIFQAFKQVSDAWMKEKVVCDRELLFIVRPVVYVDEVGVRKFVALKDGEIVGFIIFDPMYENNEVIGYIANHLRAGIQRSYSVVDFILLEAMDKFKAEGKRELSLGLSPLAKVNDGDEFRHSKLLQSYFKYAFEKANFLYNFKNLAHHKTKYRPELPGAREQIVYCAMKTRFWLPRMVDVVHVLGLSPVEQTLAMLRSKLSAYLAAHFGNKPPTQ